jgi:hypothetical protein
MVVGVAPYAATHAVARRNRRSSGSEQQDMTGPLLLLSFPCGRPQKRLGAPPLLTPLSYTHFGRNGNNSTVSYFHVCLYYIY